MTSALPPIYLDYMATTPVDDRVIDVMLHYLGRDGCFGNPASQFHSYGWEASDAVEKSRVQVASLINADAKEIVWTSGATEAINLALKGAARFYQRRGRHIVTCRTEHKAVLDCCQQLESEGFALTYLTPNSNGLLSIESVEAALRPDTIVLSILHANNEIGVIQDIAALGQLTRSKGILFHVDAAQSAGKVPVDVRAANVDLLSLSAHKIYGPKGVGALYVRGQPRLRLEPQIHGGGQERGLRSGTLATHQIVGMGEAFAIAKREMAVESVRILALRERLLTRLLEALPEVYLHGDRVSRLPGNLHLSFAGVNVSALLVAVRALALSTTATCTALRHAPSHVLNALGVPSPLADNAVRISIGRWTTQEDVDFAGNLIIEQVKRLRALSPCWSIN